MACRLTPDGTLMPCAVSMASGLASNSVRTELSAHDFATSRPYAAIFCSTDDGSGSDCVTSWLRSASDSHEGRDGTTA